MKKIFYILLFISTLFYLSIFIYTSYEYNSNNYICKWINDDKDYNSKLLRADNNITLLMMLATYNKVCKNNTEEAYRLKKKAEKLSRDTSAAVPRIHKQIVE